MAPVAEEVEQENFDAGRAGCCTGKGLFGTASLCKAIGCGKCRCCNTRNSWGCCYKSSCWGCYPTNCCTCCECIQLCGCGPRMALYPGNCMLYEEGHPFCCQDWTWSKARCLFPNLLGCWCVTPLATCKNCCDCKCAHCSPYYDCGGFDCCCCRPKYPCWTICINCCRNGFLTGTICGYPFRGCVEHLMGNRFEVRIKWFECCLCGLCPKKDRLELVAQVEMCPNGYAKWYVGTLNECRHTPLGRLAVTCRRIAIAPGCHRACCGGCGCGLPCSCNKPRCCKCDCCGLRVTGYGCGAGCGCGGPCVGCR